LPLPKSKQVPENNTQEFTRIVETKMTSLRKSLLLIFALIVAHNSALGTNCREHLLSNQSKKPSLETLISKINQDNFDEITDRGNELVYQYLKEKNIPVTKRYLYEEERYDLVINYHAGHDHPFIKSLTDQLSPYQVEVVFDLKELLRTNSEMLYTETKDLYLSIKQITSLSINDENFAHEMVHIKNGYLKETDQDSLYLGVLRAKPDTKMRKHGGNTYAYYQSIDEMQAYRQTLTTLLSQAPTTINEAFINKLKNTNRFMNEVASRLDNESRKMLENYESVKVDFHYADEYDEELSHTLIATLTHQNTVLEIPLVGPNKNLLEARSMLQSRLQNLRKLSLRHRNENRDISQQIQKILQAEDRKKEVGALKAVLTSSNPFKTL